MFQLQRQKVWSYSQAGIPFDGWPTMYKDNSGQIWTRMPSIPKVKTTLGSIKDEFGNYKPIPVLINVYFVIGKILRNNLFISNISLSLLHLLINHII